MGITSKSIELIEKALKLVDVKEVMELGAQNMFDKSYEGIKHEGQHSAQPFASEFYKAKGIAYNCIDLNGENNAFVYDLSEPIPHEKQYRLVTDFGTGEHVKSAYNVFKNIHNLLEEGGVAIRENPKTGSWEGHGCNYMTKEIYNQLAELQGYKIIELYEHAAMGNEIDGWLICCAYQKMNDFEFISEETFNQLNTPKE